MRFQEQYHMLNDPIGDQYHMVNELQGPVSLHHSEHLTMVAWLCFSPAAGFRGTHVIQRTKTIIHFRLVGFYILLVLFCIIQ